MTLRDFLIVAGLGHFGVLTASFLVPRVLDWNNALRPLPEFLRRLFRVYGAFIVLTTAAFGVLTLAFAASFAAGQPLARGLAAFIALFWGVRLAVQLFVFDARPWLTTRWLKLGYHVLTLAFLYFAAVYGWAAFAP